VKLSRKILEQNSQVKLSSKILERNSRAKFLSEKYGSKIIEQAKLSSKQNYRASKIIEWGVH
jgi:hypothetical protein